MHIELELQSPQSQEDLYALRNYLQEQMPHLTVRMREVAPQEGQMVVAMLTGIVIEGMIEAIAGETIHGLYDRVLKGKLNEWFSRKNKTSNSNIEVLSTIKSSDTKTHFVQDNQGGFKVYDHVNYAIDTDRTRAILIGSGEFEGAFSPIPPIQGNLEDFTAILTDKRHIGLPAENITVLYNKSNTEIEEKLLSTSRMPNVDTLLIYYAGHGHRTDLKKLYLIAKNTKKIDDYILGGIDFDFINQVILKPSPAKQKILIIDACHSGIATQSGDSLVPEVEVKGTYILTSSPGDEVSYFDKKARNTYFTGSLIELFKSGIENTNEMLALDDLYEHSKSFLNTKQFPSPISKSQLNIPASQFYIARNPLFSSEKLKRRPSQLYSQGKLQDALYEYELLLQKYPDDLQLRKDADHCRSQLVFTQLVNDADELFYQYKNYPAALQKYRKAIQIRQDDMLAHKIHQCEERIRNAGIEIPKESPEEKLKQPLKEPEEPPLAKKQKEPLPSPAPSPERKPQEKIPPLIEGLEGPVATNQGFTGTPIALIFLTIVIVAFFTLNSNQYTLKTTSYILVAILVLIFISRGRKLLNTELILYIYAAVPLTVYLAVELSRYPPSTGLLAGLATVPPYLIYGKLKRRVTRLSATQFIFGTLAFIGLSSFGTGMAVFVLADKVWGIYDDGEYAIAGLIVGGILGLYLSYKLFMRRRKPKTP